MARGLEALVGVALIILGLSALAGVGDGNPITAVKEAGRAGGTAAVGFL